MAPAWSTCAPAYLSLIIPWILPRFDSQDSSRPVGNWLRAIENRARAYGWSPMQQITAAMNCLDGPAKAWSLRQYDVATWAEFREDLELEFGDDVSTADVVSDMHRRKKKANETPREYVQVMRNLGDQAESEI